MVVDRVNEHFSILDEYERRRIETLLVGFGTRFPGKFLGVRPPQMQFKAFRNVLPTLYMLDLYISMIHLYIYINEFNIDTELSKICVS